MAMSQKMRIETDLTGHAMESFGFILRAVNAGLTPSHPKYLTAAALMAALAEEKLAEIHAVRPLRFDS
jgi:hypothetical protein